MYILNGSGSFPETKVLCTHHLDGICTFILSVYGVLFYCSAFIWVTFSIYDSSTGLNMLSKSAYNINGTMNWHWPLQNFGNFSFSEGIFTLTWPFSCSTHWVYLLMKLSKNHLNSKQFMQKGYAWLLFRFDSRWRKKTLHCNQEYIKYLYFSIMSSFSSIYYH